MNKYTIEQSGRSMIEMLGVLAIVGVLSVAGIAGYSKAMAKYKVNKLTDQVTMTAANIRTTFAGQGDYNGLTNDVAHSLGVFPEEMDKDCGTSKCKPMNAMGGHMYVKQAKDGTNADGSTGKPGKYAFDMVVDGLSKDACSTLVTADWGSAAGLEGILKTVAADSGETYAGKGTDAYTAAEMQSSGITNASAICTCTSAKNNCIVGWRFK